MHRFQLFAVLRESEFPRHNLVTCGATELLETCGFMLFLNSAIYRLHLGDDVDRSKQGDATLKIFADLFASIVESELSTRPRSVTTIAVMTFEDVCGQLIGSLARELRGFLSVRAVSRLVLKIRFAHCGVGGEMLQAG